MGWPFFGSYPPKEFNRYQFLNELESYEGPIRERIHFLENLTANELTSYYQACDVFTSISLHNDEDFGMSPAEALL